MQLNVGRQQCHKAQSVRSSTLSWRWRVCQAWQSRLAVNRITDATAHYDLRYNVPSVTLYMWLEAENTGQIICGQSIPEPIVGDGQGVHMASW